ncbi:spore cortex biosynthesis protein [hydrocarbon metagenome]|uniref:Spore cortex biosynthesis protein n=1 Tax=hydrocarbon metagenome TaxID=938273 RepID=A0A0W8E9B0_9ZZZZ
MPGIFFQLEAFFFTMILGLFSGVILHYYQLLIRNARVTRIYVYILDMIFWVLMVMVVFMGMLYINQGEMRSYVLIALILGAVTYFKILSARWEQGLLKLADVTIAVVKLFTKVGYYYPREILYRIKKMVVIHRGKDDEQNEEK